jgi:hypothetical protein
MTIDKCVYVVHTRRTRGQSLIPLEAYFAMLEDAQEAPSEPATAVSLVVNVLLPMLYLWIICTHVHVSTCAG